MIKAKTLLFILVLTSFCSTKNDGDTTDISSKDFKDLTEIEKLDVYGQLGEDFIGDYLLYSGQVIDADKSTFHPMDTSSYIELLLDRDDRFAIRTKHLENVFKTDTAEWHLAGGQTNLCVGTWKEEGDIIRLHFSLGSASQFFDTEENNDIIEVIDNSTALLRKTADYIWIWKTHCKKISE